MRDNNTDFSEWFYYDETSPSFLRWKVDRYSGKGLRIKKVSAGDVAGTPDPKGYWAVKLKCVLYKTHRVVAALHGISIDGLIDHVDGNPSNNNINNLRASTYHLNSHNVKMSVANKSGVTGVCWYAQTNKAGVTRTSVLVQWREGGEVCRKYFQVSRFGLLPAFAMGVRFREAVIDRLNSEGAGYTDRHGLPIETPRPWASNRS